MQVNMYMVYAWYLGNISWPKLLATPMFHWYLDINNFWKNIAFEHLCERLYDELVLASPYSI